jgi:hypothetical protein
MNEIKLKPCPCGGKAVKTKLFSAKRYDCFYKCDRCGYETKVYVSPQGAKNAWNRRADDDDSIL